MVVDSKQAIDENEFLAKLLEHLDAEHALNKLAQCGLNREFVVSLLRVITTFGSRQNERLFPIPKDLRQLAARVESVANDIAEHNRDRILGLQASPGLDPNLKSLFGILPSVLSSFSDHLRFQSGRLAEVGKTKPSRKKLLIVHLLDYAKRITGDEHYNEIALLLTAAEAAYGNTKTIEPTALKAQLERYRVSMKKGRSHAQ